MRGTISKWSLVAALGLAIAAPGTTRSGFGQDTQGGAKPGANRPKLPTPGAAGAGGGSTPPSGPNTPPYPGGAGDANGGSMNAPGAPGAKKAPGAPSGPPQNARPPGERGGGAGQGVDGAGPAGAPGAGGAAAGDDKLVQDFETPVKGAESFLSAVKSKNVEHLSKAVAKRSQFEAKPEKQGFFKQILDKEIDAEDVDKLAREFDGMKFMFKNVAKSTGSIGVVVGKQVKNDTIMRTLTMRREQEGWKVMDYSGQRVAKGFNNGQASGRKKR